MTFCMVCIARRQVQFLRLLLTAMEAQPKNAKLSDSGGLKGSDLASTKREMTSAMSTLPPLSGCSALEHTWTICEYSRRNIKKCIYNRAAADAQSRMWSRHLQCQYNDRVYYWDLRAASRLGKNVSGQKCFRAEDINNHYWFHGQIEMGSSTVWSPNVEAFGYNAPPESGCDGGYLSRASLRHILCRTFHRQRIFVDLRGFVQLAALFVYAGGGFARVRSMRARRQLLEGDQLQFNCQATFTPCFKEASSTSAASPYSPRPIFSVDLLISKEKSIAMETASFAMFSIEMLNLIAKFLLIFNRNKSWFSIDV